MGEKLLVNYNPYAKILSLKRKNVSTDEWELFPNTSELKKLTMGKYAIQNCAIEIINTFDSEYAVGTYKRAIIYQGTREDYDDFAEIFSSLNKHSLFWEYDTENGDWFNNKGGYDHA